MLKTFLTCVVFGIVEDVMSDFDVVSRNSQWY